MSNKRRRQLAEDARRVGCLVRSTDLAQHPRLPRCDALKILGTDVSADEDYRQRFTREADLAATLWHPHIVGVHDRGEEDGQLWISMDFVDGLDGARLLADRYPAGMPVEEVARIVTAVASALDYAHKQGLLHRDVKPANIMMTNLDEEGEQRILLTDFGIARNVNDISGLTKTNMTVGTVAYCAPEQLLGEDIDGRADQYSLAATAFHLLTGSQLFPNSNPAVVISHHLNVPPPALADSRPDLAALDPVLAVGLAKRPEDRFRRCSDFAQALGEQITTDGSTTHAAPTKPAPVPSRSSRVVSRRRWLIPAAGLAVVLLAGGIALAWRPWEAHQSSSVGGTSERAQTTAAPTLTTTSTPQLPSASSTMTTTVPSTDVRPAGAAIGLPCDPSDAAKITYDGNTGKDIVCMNEGPLKYGTSSPLWEWAETPISMMGVHATGTPCNPELEFWSKTPDSYLIDCVPAQLGPTPGYWQHCGVRKRAEGYVCGP